MCSVSFSSISNHYSSCSTQTILLIHLASLLVWIFTQLLSLKSRHTWFGHVTAHSYTSSINFIEIQLLLPLQQPVVHFSWISISANFDSPSTRSAPIATHISLPRHDAFLRALYQFHRNRTIGCLTAHWFSVCLNSHPCWFHSPGNRICSNCDTLGLAMSPHASTHSVSFSSISNHYSSCSTQTILLIHLASLLVWISTQLLSL